MNPLIRRAVRAKTRDMLTFDTAIDPNLGYAPGARLGFACRTHDGRTVDSTGAFLVGELERLDQTLHEPLIDIRWSRDIDLREDVSIADEVSSYTLSTFGTPGGLGTGQANGISWIGKNSSEIQGVSLDIAKVPHPLRLWGESLAYTIPELESAAKMGRPIDQQKYAGLKKKHQLDIDRMVYVGDSTLSAYGLVNSDSRSAGLDQVTNVSNVVNGAGGSPLWTNKTPDEILADVNEVLTSAWAAAAWEVVPNRLLVPPSQFGYISTTKVSSAGNVSILTYLLENNISRKQGVSDFNIFPAKWCIGTGVGGTQGTVNGHDRMVAYTKDKERVRYPMTMLQRTPIQFQDIRHITYYYCRLGELEIVYPQTVAYRDGL